jgi:hypothetical protein
MRRPAIPNSHRLSFPKGTEVNKKFSHGIDFHCSSEDNFVRSAKPIDASEVSFARKSIAAA